MEVAWGFTTEKPGGIGWNIMIRMELLQSLPSHAAGIPLPTEEVVKLV
ncbi:MAG: hypothetical protein LBB49_07080 [Gracilibacteraceae bacterium]|jgi:hypothetical protein|nr:hypothetical protein [Gracilibacteraceae bacterium]